jgi:hypothetical protein
MKYILTITLALFVTTNAFSDTSFVGKKLMCVGKFNGYHLLKSFEFVSTKKVLTASYHETMSKPLYSSTDLAFTSREIWMTSATLEGWGRYETILDRRTLKLNYVTVDKTVHMNCDLFNGTSENLDKLMIEQWNINRKNTQNKNKL